MSLSSEGTPELVAFEQLVAEYEDRVYGIALRITGSPTEAEDVMQDAFLDAFRAWASFRGEAAATTWLYRIAVNAALRRIRSRRPVDYLSDAGEPYDEIVDWSANLDQTVIQHELQERLQDGILQLPEDLRLTFVLRDIEGLSAAETAAVLSTPETEVAVQTVHTRLHRARVLLRAHLAAYFRDR
jgi:RNA polymerase sigma-70 factor (ECF subfamily)